EWNRRAGEWLPTGEDRAFVKGLMQPVREPGRIAGWIAPPSKGINGNPFDFEYVRL
ncbi:MAG: benzoyl-CoA 2,3-epoxidase subunit BoxB, partial [Planctomycetota bacterium]